MYTYTEEKEKEEIEKAGKEEKKEKELQLISKLPAVSSRSHEVFLSFSQTNASRQNEEIEIPPPFHLPTPHLLLLLLLPPLL